MHPQLIASLLLCLVPVSLSGCGSADSPAAQAGSVDIVSGAPSAGVAESSAQSSGDTSATTSQAAAQGEPAAGLALPRKVAYAGLNWTVETAKISQGPDGRVVLLDVSVVNALDDRNFRIPAGMLALALPDDTLARADEYVGLSGSLEVKAQARAKAILSIPLPDGTDLATTSFTVIERGKVPAKVPLAGPAPEPGLPRKLAVIKGGSQPVTAMAQNAGPRAATAELIGGEVSLDNGFERADTGTVFVRFTIRLTGSDNIYSASLPQSHLQLVVDGVARGPKSSSGRSVHAGESTDVEAVWEVPAGTRTVLVRAGNAKARQATFQPEWPAGIAAAAH